MTTDHVTHDDTTPYAQAVLQGRCTGRRDRRAARRRMRQWVVAAGHDRLHFLARIGPSAVARSFAWRNVVLVALAAGFWAGTSVGWHGVVRTPDNASHLWTAPEGSGWIRVAGADDADRAKGLIALWWNPALSGGAFLVGVVGALLLIQLSVVVWSWMVERLLGPFRGQGRLRTAVAYGTTFVVGLHYAGWLMVVRPVRDALYVSGWRFLPSNVMVETLAVALCALSGVLGWFWLIRLCTTLPAPARTRMTVFFSVGVGVWTAGVVVGAVYGFCRLAEVLPDRLGMGWSGT